MRSGDTIVTTSSIFFGGGREIESGRRGLIVAIAPELGDDRYRVRFDNDIVVLSGREMEQIVTPFFERYTSEQDALEHAASQLASIEEIMSHMDSTVARALGVIVHGASLLIEK